MTIGSINGANTNSYQMKGMAQGTDSFTKNIQSQIANAQKQLQEISSNKELSIEEKMKKRQEIQQQISDLNNQLRQHQIEQRKEQQQSKGSSMDDMLGGQTKVRSKSQSGQSAGLSQASMRAMISADSSMKQAEVAGSVATKMEGRAGVLKAEIKQDAALGQDTRKKEEELAEVEQIAMEATTAQMGTLNDANTAMEEAREETEAANKENGKVESSDEKADDSKKEMTVEAEVDSEQKAVQTSLPENYNPVDVRL